MASSHQRDTVTSNALQRHGLARLALVVAFAIWALGTGIESATGITGLDEYWHSMRTAIQSFELECNAMPVPVALINWWGGLDAALVQASWLRDQLVAAWDREISTGGEMP